MQEHAVWAKLRGFPAWPAQVLSAHAGHQAPPKPKRPGCVLVHFFGTYDIQWLESDKKARAPMRTRTLRERASCDVTSLTPLPCSQVSPFHDNFEQYSAACKQKARAASAACCRGAES